MQKNFSRSSTEPWPRPSLPPKTALLLSFLFAFSTSAVAAEPDRTQAGALSVETVVLDNGMTLLVVPRPGHSVVHVGWVVPTGSYDDPPGASGMAHLVEHLLFKGSQRIGTTSYEREKPILDEEDRIIEKLATLGPAKDKKRSQLAQRLEEVRRQATELARLGEYSLLYSEAGATGLNAFTFKDFTMHLASVPSEKLELWFWLEADRFAQPVLREFYKEVDVVLEERRQRIEATSTGRQDEEFNRSFWNGSGYGRATLGTPEELVRIARPEAMLFMKQALAPERLTAVFVGGVDAKMVRKLGNLYLGQLQNGQSAPPSAQEPSAGDSDRTADNSRWTAECECPTQVKVYYPAVPFGAEDSYPLQVLAGVLNGRSGRLHKTLVREEELGRSAEATFQPYRHAGVFAFTGVTKGVTQPEDLIAAWDREVARLQETPPTSQEVERVRNQLAANGFRRLQDPANLRSQLLVYAGLGNWREISEGLEQVRRVTPDDVQHVARKYLKSAGRTVGVYVGESR